MFSSIVHISPTTSLVVGTNPPAHPQWHDAVLDLHAHEYTACPHWWTAPIFTLPYLIVMCIHVYCRYLEYVTMVQKSTKYVKYTVCFPMGNFSFICGTHE